MYAHVPRVWVIAGLVSILITSSGTAQVKQAAPRPLKPPPPQKNSGAVEKPDQPLSLDGKALDFSSPPLYLGETSKGVSAHLPAYTDEPFDNLYREVSDFFNIREANPQVVKGEWEIEASAFWDTKSNGDDDSLALEQSVKYGFTNNFFVELEVLEPNIGDGGEQGAGDIELIVFNRFVKEVPGEDTPGIAGYLEARFPTGDHSRNTDILASGVITKSLGGDWRAHFQAWVESANGGYSDDEDDGRRDVQFGWGPGFDYQVDEKTMLLFNYLNKSGEKYGEHNNNILELGATYEIAKSDKFTQHIKAAVDIGLDGQDETPNCGARFLWSISWE